MRIVFLYRRRLLPAAFTAAAVAVGVSLAAAPADAHSTATIKAAAESTTVVARQGQWAIAAVNDYAMLTVREPRTGAIIGESIPGIGWVAIDFHPGARQPGEYLLENSDPTFKPETQFIDGSAALLSFSTTTVGWDKQDWLVDLRHIWLNAGDQMRLTVRGAGVGSVSIVHTGPQPEDPRTRNWTTADANFPLGKPEVDDVNTAWFTAPASTDYGVIFTRGTFGDTAQVQTWVRGRPMVGPLLPDRSHLTAPSTPGPTNQAHTPLV